jgi:hypothetical protein
VIQIWRAEPGDVVQLPASCSPRVVTVTGSGYAPAGCNRIRWQAGRAYGSTVLPDLLEAGLRSTPRPGKQVLVNAPGTSPTPRRSRHDPPPGCRKRSPRLPPRGGRGGYRDRRQ